MSELSFVIAYSTFVFFFLLIVTMGGPSFLSEDSRVQLEALTVPTERPAFIDVPIIGPIVGFLTGVWEGILLFYNLLTLSSTIFFVSTLVMTPLLIGLFYIALRLLRGGG